MNLKTMRENVGLKQTELADISGVNLRSLQDYEQGHKSLTCAKGETLLRLSTVLGYSIEEILKGTSVEIKLPENSAESLRESRLIAYEKCLNSRKDIEVHFPVIYSDEYVDMSRIYPTKQGIVKNVINQIRLDENISSLLLFGSSITMECHKGSDVDFAVRIKETSNDVRNKISEKIQSACNWNADIIWMDHISTEDRIYKNIMKGLVLV